MEPHSLCFVYSSLSCYNDMGKWSDISVIIIAEVILFIQLCFM